MRFIYSLFVAFWAGVITLKYTYDRFKHQKFKGILLYKLGFLRQKIKPTLKKKRIWIHATSFGETMSIKTLIKKLKKENTDCHIVFSAFTTVGYHLAETIEDVDQVVILPVDLRRSVRALIKSIQPDLFILTESDYWLNLLAEMKRYGAKMILVGGRISDRSFKRFLLVPSFARYLFSSFDHLLLQDKSMERKFLKLGVDPSKIEVIGNLKLDVSVNSEPVEKDYFLEGGKRYITFGSTHKGEEVLFLETLHSLPDDITFILAPRRPDRFDEVETLLNDSEVKWRFVADRGDGDERVVFVNRLGILDDCYQKSLVAIVGGSFVKNAGGHNVFEPVKVGTPVLYGPYAYNQDSLTQLVEKYGSGESCTADALLGKVSNLLEKGKISPESMNEIKKDCEGVTEKAINLINSLLKKSSLC
ncbi:MAG: 3-deoxy-D-manno-octulosonic acid transferase [Chlamydiia bacterium]|nr:3-deoxy-D-manno-octulosonic acid transferase [Chlamydiia bacterium]MCH9618328.1 3-deoxy-D-manno-octulosonic acid transferase [Chlamydiia bacterium]MCH9624500.1 3-deoxy-D-manno-octulosonic acid transferase [Chlamydiia bacterium]